MRSGLGWLRGMLTTESLWDGEQHGRLGPRCGVWERRCVSVQDMLNLSGTRPRGNGGPERFVDSPGVTQTVGVKAQNGTEVL